MVNGPFIRVIILAGLFRHSNSASREINHQDNEAVDDPEGKYAGKPPYIHIDIGLLSI